MAYVFVFENRGRMIGSTIEHPHSQVMAFGMIPPLPAAELSATTCHLCLDPADDLLVTRRGSGMEVAPSAPAAAAAKMAQAVQNTFNQAIDQARSAHLTRTTIDGLYRKAWNGDRPGGEQ